MEFKSFEKINKFTGIGMTITQKIHGTNAQVSIMEAPYFVPVSEQEVIDVNSNLTSKYVWSDSKLYEIAVGSRTRHIIPGDDNFGFARFVYSNKVAFVEKLGLGTHYGEWAGPGINSGEGLEEKTFVLFAHHRFPAERSLPPQCVVVPVLYHGPYYENMVEFAMNDLKTNGSKLSPGFMRPEGVVVEIQGKKFKKVFEAEETKWTQGSAGPKPPKLENEYDASHLLQPIRLEKLLSKDERYLKNYPESLRDIVFAYQQDLIDEGQIVGTEMEIRSIKKAAGGQFFDFVRKSMEKLQPPA